MCFYHGKNINFKRLDTSNHCMVVCLSRFYQDLCLDVTRVSDLLSACLLSVYLPGRFILAVNKQTFLSKKTKKKHLSAMPGRKTDH